eukprot:883805-Prymnesium_polylepis.1
MSSASRGLKIGFPTVGRWPPPTKVGFPTLGRWPRTYYRLQLTYSVQSVQSRLTCNNALNGLREERSRVRCDRWPRSVKRDRCAMAADGDAVARCARGGGRVGRRRPAAIGWG